MQDQPLTFILYFAFLCYISHKTFQEPYRKEKEKGVEFQIGEIFFASSLTIFRWIF